ncbi:hypothetical protein APS56_13850 [Pseudalgibacter alginicilyticus]|uniref:Methane oxygenase PmoA n=1 Tax=Pseudalgibacter alginicilyticus TaxID=1736674 RepID=A0A0P0CZQ6_9FLAO|nr:DUF6807 family protein [Pseudalgibacter alginicilyticus]ALJ06145.1 hypothetical protein APS56_13850 [Pseudalgibacter alginicilyticus]
MNLYYITFCFIFISNVISAQKVDLIIKNDAAYFLEEKDSILNYQIAEKSLNGTYTRTNYIHPLYTLDGEILTEDFPPDHYHHRGVFWAWHQLYVGDKRIGDAWLIDDFSWEVINAIQLKPEEKSTILKVEVLWKSPQWRSKSGKQKPLVKEITKLKVYPLKENYRQIDIEISIQALEKNMRIGGSEDAKGYGGFSQRLKNVENIKFTGSQGKIEPTLLPVEADGWIDISGPFDQDDNLSGLSILSHPNNPGFPNPWILRSKNSMQNAVYPFPGKKAIPLSETHPTILRYRLLIHRGEANQIDIASKYVEFQK